MPERITMSTTLSSAFLIVALPSLWSPSIAGQGESSTSSPRSLKDCSRFETWWRVSCACWRIDCLSSSRCACLSSSLSISRMVFSIFSAAPSLKLKTSSGVFRRSNMCTLLSSWAFEPARLRGPSGCLPTPIGGKRTSSALGPGALSDALRPFRGPVHGPHAAQQLVHAQRPAARAAQRRRRALGALAQAVEQLQQRLVGVPQRCEAQLLPRPRRVHDRAQHAHVQPARRGGLEAQ